MTTEISTKEETLSIVNDILLSMIDNVASAKNFLIGEVPDVVTQLLYWHGIENFISFFIGCLPLILSFIFYEKWKKLFEASYKVSQELLAPIFLLPALAVICLFLFSTRMLNLVWLKILVAPKLYLLEYAAELIK